MLEAIDPGLHVIADKPFAPTYDGAIELDAAAKAKGVTLGVYQNRRFHAGLQTLKTVIKDDRVAKVYRIESRMDQDSPHTLEAGPAAGLLRDPDSYVVDQMIYLRGPVVSVDAQLDMVDLRKGPADAGFMIALRRACGAHSHVSACKLNPIDDSELWVIGDKGSCVSRTIDIHAQGIFAGKSPTDDLAGCGYEPQANWGTLRTHSEAAQVPSEQGCHDD